MAFLLSTSACFLLLAFIPATISQSQTQININTPAPLYEGMLCQYGRDCDSSATLMKCLSLNRGPYQCRCEPFRAGVNIGTQPYYNQEIGKCVIRVNQTCALPGGGGGWEEYKCEPNAECEPDEQVRDQERYGLCAGAASVVAHLLLSLTMTIPVLACSLRNSA